LGGGGRSGQRDDNEKQEKAAHRFFLTIKRSYGRAIASKLKRVEWKGGNNDNRG
jgi:hypothetical protein